jgi:hypothetical protein
LPNQATDDDFRACLPLLCGQAVDVHEELRVEEFGGVFVAEHELPVVLGEGLELFEHLHTDNAQRLLLTASLLQSPLSALRSEDSEEPEASHRISPLEHLVVRVAGEVAEKAE